MERIADWENLLLAFWKAAKGKRGKADCRAFQERLASATSASACGVSGLSVMLPKSPRTTARSWSAVAGGGTGLTPLWPPEEVAHPK
jgi:hypothetical protein